MMKTLTYQSSGQGLALVFIHGWGLNSAIWQPLKEKLLPHYQIITIDLPGFGANRNVQLHDYSLANVSQLIANSINQPAVYVGWSLGGLVASYIALHHSNKVKGLITVASSPYFIEEKVQGEVLWYGIKKPVLQGFYQQLEENIEKTLTGFLKIQAMGSPNIRQDIKQLQSLVLQYPTPTKQTLAKSLCLLETTDLRQQLKNIQQPFLRLYGRLDSLVPKKSIALIDQLAPQSEHYIFEHASHAPFISHPEIFQTQLTQWLALYFY